jgi:phosphoribosylaminoimidazole-succinocarboxamide synthase
MKPLRLLLLASGRGSHAVNLIHATRDGRLDGTVLRVVSDRPDAPVLEQARALGVPVTVLLPFREGARLAPDAEESLRALVAEERANLVALCGFMRLLRAPFLARVGVTVVNVHPSLLPAFPGLNAQERAIEAGSKETGVTVHVVDAGMDTGPIVLQRRIAIRPGETVDELTARLLPLEHEAYVEALRRLQNGGFMATPERALRDVVIPGRAPDYRGKVRDLYLLGDQMLLVATDRVSAYDVILNEGIPGKGRILTQISKFWFEKLAPIVPTHFITCDLSRFPEPFSKHPELLEGRSMLAHRAKRYDVECVVRGYLAGSGWKEYQASGEVCGVKLPPGLKLSSKLPEPIFTPATKAEEGHDENISFERMAGIVGAKRAEELRAVSLAIYKAAAEHAASCGLILADTKFEFGERDGAIVWIDEALSPDSSRYWLMATYRDGAAQDSFDKQVIRDYLDSIRWNRMPPPPALPEGVVAKAGRRYEEALEMITGAGVVGGKGSR